MLKKVFLSACCILALSVARDVSAQQQSQMNAAAIPYVMFDSAPGAFQLAKDGVSAKILVDANDWAGVIRAAKDLGDDVGKVTGKPSEVVTTAGTMERGSVVVGTIGKSKFIDSLIANKKIDVSKIKGQWESFLIQTVDGCLVVAGSDRRGTIFGIYDISEKIGVSPWYWWADVPAKKHDSLFIVPGTFLQGPPKVKYRGIFINDEEPAFGPWSRAKFGGINSKMYVHMFELILRLKGNYLWPAMWGKAFNEDDPDNPRLADEYGIVMGTSHHEPMMRNQEEWTKRNRGNRLGAWNYNTNKDNLYSFWKEGITRNAKYDNLVTVGMRGDGDEPMAGRGSKMEDNIRILTNVINDQRTLIAEAYGKPASEVPQMWAIYKEVQDYYDAGMRVADDITILWCDDNWGNVRRLPTPEERKRSGGAGIYYHVDYVGGPHSYRWLNTNPLPKMWEQLNLTYRWGADRVWILNVGDLKPMEIPIDFFLKFAYDPDAIPQSKIGEYTLNWAKEQFGDEHAEEIADIVAKYAKYNGWRKPEILEANTFSVANNYEADGVVEAWLKLVDRAETLRKKIPAEYKDAYFELVYHPVKASAQVAELQVDVGKNRLYARQGRASANNFAKYARDLMEEDQKLADVYNNELAGGKWIHMMDQPHIGTSKGWDTPDRNNQMPQLSGLNVPDVSEIGVAVENSEQAWPATEELMLPVFDSWNPVKHTFEVFARGSKEAKFTVKSTEKWIKTDIKEDYAAVVDVPVNVEIDWSAVKNGTNTGYIEVTGPNGTAKIRVAAVKADAPAAKNGVKAVWGALAGPISIPAGKPAKISPAGGVTWDYIPDYGRGPGGMCVFPVTADSVTDYTKAPSMEYPVYISEPGRYDVTLYTSPTLNFVPGRGLRIAVGMDDDKPAVIDAYAGRMNWDALVKDNCRQMRAQLEVATVGIHIFKIYMVDPAVVVEKIVISSGRLPQTYFGPDFTTPVKTK
ncbi:MAG: glycosyl hydrolase 115 family protein [Lentisphaeria bacterium]|nr:glycosyl hydrolase 115 family protein [Lentisphaeria bacterium]